MTTCEVCGGVGEIEVRPIDSDTWAIYDCFACADGMTVIPLPRRET